METIFWHNRLFLNIGQTECATLNCCGTKFFQYKDNNYLIWLRELIPKKEKKVWKLSILWVKPQIKTFFVFILVVLNKNLGMVSGD